MIFLDRITIVDACMGRGKTTAAIRYMNEHKSDKRFLFITPYLSEVGRVCEMCDFEEPKSDITSKLAQLKALMHRRQNVVSTHALFTYVDDEVLSLAKENSYSLIIDESLDVINSVPITPKDKELLFEKFAEVGDEGLVHWTDAEYDGKLSDYKEIADRGSLYCVTGSMMDVMNPNRLTSFDDIHVLTYMFQGQLMRAYLDFFGLEYNIVGVEKDEHGFRFSDRPDEPEQVDYNELIGIVGRSPRDARDWNLNEVGKERTALSVSWYKQHRRSDKEITKLRYALRAIATRGRGKESGGIIWTTYKSKMEWLLGSRGRYRPSFLPLNARATNKYRAATTVAYLANRFVDPNYVKFFSQRGVSVSSEDYALSEMLQFIWRSAIRDGKKITLYIPSKRMRGLLIDWINEMNNGGKAA